MNQNSSYKKSCAPSLDQLQEQRPRQLRQIQNNSGKEKLDRQNVINRTEINFITIF